MMNNNNVSNIRQTQKRHSSLPKVAPQQKQARFSMPSNISNNTIIASKGIPDV
jgi:hypothetical protein